MSYQEYLKYKNQQQKQQPKQQPKPQQSANRGFSDLADPFTIAKRAVKGAKKNVEKVSQNIASNVANQAVKSAAKFANDHPVISSYAVNTAIGAANTIKNAPSNIKKAAVGLTTNPEEYVQQQIAKGENPYESGYRAGRFGRNPIENFTAPGQTTTQRITRLGKDLASGANDVGKGVQHSLYELVNLPSTMYHAGALKYEYDEKKRAEHVRKLLENEDYARRNFGTGISARTVGAQPREATPDEYTNMHNLGVLGGDIAALIGTGGGAVMATGAKGAVALGKQGVKQAVKTAAKQELKNAAKAQGRAYTAKQLNNLAGVKATAQMGKLDKWAAAHPGISGIPKQIVENAEFGLGMYGLKKATGEEANLGQEMLFAQGAGLGLHGLIHGVGKPVLNSQPVQNAINNARESIGNNPELTRKLAAINGFLNLNSGIKSVDQMQAIQRNLAKTVNLTPEQMSVLQQLDAFSPEELELFQKLVLSGENPETALMKMFGNRPNTQYIDPLWNVPLQTTVPLEMVKPEPVQPRPVQQPVQQPVQPPVQNVAQPKPPVVPQTQDVYDTESLVNIINQLNNKKTNTGKPKFDNWIAKNKQEQANKKQTQPTVQEQPQVIENNTVPEQPQVVENKPVQQQKPLERTAQPTSPVKNETGINTHGQVQTPQNEPASHVRTNNVKKKSTRQVTEVDKPYQQPIENMEVTRLEPGAADGSEFKPEKTKTKPKKETYIDENGETKERYSKENIYEGVNETEQLPDIDPSIRNAQFRIITENGPRVARPIRSNGTWNDNYVITGKSADGSIVYVEKKTVSKEASVSDMNRNVKELTEKMKKHVRQGNIKKANKIGQQIKQLKESIKNAENSYKYKADEGYANESDIADAYAEEFSELEDTGTAFSEGYETRELSKDLPRYASEDYEFNIFWENYKNLNKNQKAVERIRELKNKSPNERRDFLEKIKAQEELEARRGRAKKVGDTVSEETKAHDNLETTEEVVNTAREENIDLNEKEAVEKGEVSAQVKAMSDKNWTNINSKNYESTKDIDAKLNEYYAPDKKSGKIQKLKERADELDAQIKKATYNKDMNTARKLKAEQNDINKQIKELNKEFAKLKDSKKILQKQKVNGVDAVRDKFERNKTDKAKLQEIYDTYMDDLVNSDLIQYPNTVEYMVTQLDDIASEYGVKTQGLSNFRSIKNARIKSLGQELADLQNGKVPIPEGESLESMEHNLIQQHRNIFDIPNNGDVLIYNKGAGQNVTMGDLLRDHYGRTSKKQIKNIQDLTDSDWEVAYEALKRLHPKDRSIAKLGEAYKGKVNVDKIREKCLQQARDLYKKYYKVIKNSYTDFDAPIKNTFNERTGKSNVHNFDYTDNRMDKVSEEFYKIDRDMQKRLGMDGWDYPEDWNPKSSKPIEDAGYTKNLPRGGYKEGEVVSNYNELALKDFLDGVDNERMVKILGDLKKEHGSDYMSLPKDDLTNTLKKYGHDSENREIFNQYYDLKTKVNADKAASKAKFEESNKKQYEWEDSVELEDNQKFSTRIEDYTDSNGNVKVEKLNNAIDKLKDEEWVNERIQSDAEAMLREDVVPTEKGKSNIDKIIDAKNGIPIEEENPLVAAKIEQKKTIFNKRFEQFKKERKVFYKNLLKKLDRTYGKTLKKYYSSPEYVNEVLTSGKGADKLVGKEFKIKDLANVNETCRQLDEKGLGNTRIKFEELDDPDMIAGFDTNTGDIVFNTKQTGKAFDHEIDHLENWQNPEGRALLQRQADISFDYKDLTKKQQPLIRKTNILMKENSWTKDTSQIWSKLKKAGLNNDEIKILKNLKKLKDEKKILEQINEGHAELAERGDNVRSIQEYIKEKAGTEEGKEIAKYYSDFIRKNGSGKRSRRTSGQSTTPRRYGETRGLVAKKESTQEWVRKTLGNRNIHTKRVLDVYKYLKDLSEKGTEKAVKYDIDLTADQALNRQNMKSGDGGLAVYFPKRGSGKTTSKGIDASRDYASEYLNKVGLYGIASKETPQAVTARDAMNLITMNTKRDIAVNITDQVKNYKFTKSYNGGDIPTGYKPINSSLMTTAIFGEKSPAFVETLSKGEDAIRKAFPKEEADHWIEYMSRNSKPDLLIPESLYNKLFSGYGETAREYTLRYCQPGQINDKNILGAFNKGKLYSFGKYFNAYNKVMLDLFKRDVLTSMSFALNNRIGNNILLAMSSDSPQELVNAWKTARQLKDADIPPELVGGNIADALSNAKGKRLTITGDTEIDNALNALYGNGVDLSTVTKTIKEKGVYTSSKNSLKQPAKTYGTIEKPNPNYYKQKAKGVAYNTVATYEKGVNKVRDAFANFNEKGKITLNDKAESGMFGELFERKVGYARELNKVRAKLIEDTGNKFITIEDTLKHVKDNPEIEESIIKSVCDALGDYNSFSPFEREVLKSIFPFYSWTRTISRHIVKNAEKYPARYALFALEYHRLMENEQFRRKPWQRGIIPRNMTDSRSGEQLGFNLVSSTGNPFNLELPGINPLANQAKFLATGKHDIGSVSSKKYLSKHDYRTNEDYYIDKKGRRYNSLPADARVNSILMDAARSMLFTNNKVINLEQLAQAAATGYVPDKQYEDAFGGYRKGDTFLKDRDTGEVLEQRYAYNALSNRTKLINWATGNKLQAVKPLTGTDKKKLRPKLDKKNKAWRQKYKDIYKK
jgi:hypothetical protein